MIRPYTSILCWLATGPSCGPCVVTLLTAAQNAATTRNCHQQTVDMTLQIRNQTKQQHLQSFPCGTILADKQQFLIRISQLPPPQVGWHATRHFTATSNMHSKKQPVSWPATPQLHQPAQHVQGTDPVKTLKAVNSPAMLSAGVEALTQQQAVPATNSAAGAVAHDSWLQRLRSSVRSCKESVSKVSAMQLTVIIFTCGTALLSRE